VHREFGAMSLLAELKRRKVIRVAVVYAATAFAVLQAADIMLPQMGVPEWGLSLVVALVVLGFPIAIVLGWALELTPDGLKRTAAAPSETSDVATPALLGKRTVFAAALLVVLGVGIGAGWFLRPVPVAEPDTDALIPAEKLAESPSPADSGASVAVLPFANRSAEPDSTYFVDGIHDDLLTELARNGALKVISRTSMMQYRDTTKNLRQIGEELAVATILEGAVQRSGQRVRINAQLIDARSDAHLWAETFDRQVTPENLFEIQSEIAAAIAAALGRTLGVDARAPAPMAAPTANPQAYDLFLRARAMAADYIVRTESTIRREIELYREAVAIDPGFALAMGELGLSLTDLYWFHTRQDTHRREAREWIDRAIAMAPNLPRLRWILARHLYHGELDYEGALAQLALAERDMPGSADVFGLRGWILRRDGRMEEALEALKAAVTLDPLSQEVTLSLSESYGWLGDLEQARTWADRLARIPGASSDARLEYPASRLRILGDTATLRRALAEHPPSPGSYLIPEFLMLPYYERDYAGSLTAIENHPVELVSEQFSRLPKDLLRALAERARGQEEVGRDLATAADRRIEALLADDPGDYRLMMSRALALALLGEAESARDWARRALDSPVVAKDTLLRSRLLGDRLRVLALVDESSTVARELEDYLGMPIKYVHFDGLMLDPVFDRHREHPAFKALAAKYSRKGPAQ
jgi:TolB-like protein/Tfp pilus assembly protein PilF